MILSGKWLKDFVNIEIDPKQFAHNLTMTGSKVEGYKIEGEEIKNVVVGKILSIEVHPDADKLLVCQMDVGKGAPVQIVTGATNLKAGDVVPVALHKSALPGGKEITRGKLRGIMSDGMLCSLSELGLAAGDFPYAIEDGIFVLEESCEMGENIQSAIGLDDIAIEFEITPNRPDCLSVIGLAREVAATYHLPFTLNRPQVKGSGGDINELLSVEVQSPLCQRYAAKVVKNVKIGPSPRWLRERLRASGVRPINNLVDITNYVMLEYGQPMHAFDLRYVEGGRITVRTAQKGERITTLDGMDRLLSEEMLVICDAKKPVAVAGVMGGEYSGIMGDTVTVVFESACFNGPSVRTTAKALGMRTESSGRFEKGLDPEACMQALLRACQLVEELEAGEVVDGAIDVGEWEHTPVTIDLEPEWINRFIGIDMPVEQMAAILTKLEFEVKDGKVVAPSFRADVRHKADLAEEIARFYGYDKIPETVVRGIANGRWTEEQKFERYVRETLVALGSYECLTYSFISPKYYDKVLLPADSPLRRSVVIANPLGEDTSIMRTLTIPSMLEVISRNYSNRNLSANLFEIGTEYHPVEGEQLPNEVKKLTIAAYGDGQDFYTVKGMVEALFTQIHLTGWRIEAVNDHPTFHPGRCGKLTADGEIMGYIGEVHPAVLENYGIGVRACVAYLDFETLFAKRGAEITYIPLPKFPAVTRDLALLCDDATPVAALEDAIREGCGNLLEKLDLFDVYRGQQIAEGKKSVAYSLTLRSGTNTLTDGEVDAKIEKALKALALVGASLRK